MKIIKPFVADLSEKIFKEIEGRPFVAISYDAKTEKYIFHINRMSSESVVFCCNAMIKRELEELGDE